MTEPKIVRSSRDGDYSARYAATLKAENAALREKLAVAREALEPFAKHLDEMQFDRDFHGNELPDDQAAGWVYVTNGDFRRARQAHTQIDALTGGDNAEG